MYYKYFDRNMIYWCDEHLTVYPQYVGLQAHSAFKPVIQYPTSNRVVHHGIRHGLTENNNRLSDSSKFYPLNGVQNCQHLALQAFIIATTLPLSAVVNNVLLTFCNTNKMLSTYCQFAAVSI